ncbi:MAG: glycosyl transferase family protein [Gammaproteobacteria bacterium]|nr:glycosyl transferase family protein [Gammaproteobacteria bacterium]
MSEHEFAPFIRALGKGPRGRRDLSAHEAFDAMTAIIEQRVTQAQLGAFLMLLRVKEESIDELTGFVRAIEAKREPTDTQYDISWSTYSGKRKQPHWFLLAAAALSSRYTIALHGGSEHTPERIYTQHLCHQLDIPIQTPGDQPSSLVYIPLSESNPTLDRLLMLRDEFGLRSPLNSVLRLHTPVDASTSVMSVFHPNYAEKHQHAARQLKRRASLVFKGDAGEAEIRPTANTTVFIQRSTILTTDIISRRIPLSARIERAPSASELAAQWHHDLRDYGYHAVLATMTAVLMAHEGWSQDTASGIANEIWSNRDRNRFKSAL